MWATSRVSLAPSLWNAGSARVLCPRIHATVRVNTWRIRLSPTNAIVWPPKSRSASDRRGTDLAQAPLARGATKKSELRLHKASDPGPGADNSGASHCIRPVPQRAQ